MAKFSMKKGGKEVGPAEVYAEPHTMTGGKISIGNGYDAQPSQVSEMKVSVGNINKAAYSPAAKSEGIEIRGCGAATKGTKARGPMA